MSGTILQGRALIRLSGPDVRGFLQGLITNDVALLAPDRPLWAGLLTPQGKTLFDFLAWADGEDVLLDCERDAAGDLAKRLTLYRLRRPLEIAREPDLCVHWSRDGAGVPDPRLPELGHRWLAPDDGGPAADEAWLRHRLSFGVTEGRAELSDLLWLECNAAELNGVSFTKGCYVGQENTARMHHRSKVGRRLFVLPRAEEGARVRVPYPQLGLSVAHLRVDDRSDALVPAWVTGSLNA